MRFIHDNSTAISNFRINALQWGIFFLAFIIIGRLFYVQIMQHDFYLDKGQSQRYISQDIKPERGRIFALTSTEDADDLYPLAVNKVYYEISVDPSKITRPQNITDIFTEILILDEEEANKNNLKRKE